MEMEKKDCAIFGARKLLKVSKHEIGVDHMQIYFNIWIFLICCINKIEGILSNKVFVEIVENEKFIEETKGALKNAKLRFVADQMRVPADEGNDSN